MTLVDAGAVVLLREQETVAVAVWGADRAARREAALRAAAAELTGRPAGEFELGAEVCPDCGRPHGAPFAIGTGERIRLSLAHAGQASIAAASLRAAVGADAVDTARTGNAAEHPDPRSWARIEAVLKADGRGLRVAPERIRFAADGGMAELDGTTYRLIDLTLDSLEIAIAVSAPSAAPGDAA